MYDRGSSGLAIGGRHSNPCGRIVTRRRSQSVLESQIAQPERLGLWAFLLGLFLMVVAAGTANA